MASLDCSVSWVPSTSLLSMARYKCHRHFTEEGAEKPYILQSFTDRKLIWN